jgi:hypothetical protein
MAVLELLEMMNQQIRLKNRDSVPCNAVTLFLFLLQLPNTFHLIGELDDSKLASNSISIPLFCIVAKFP